MEKLLTLRPCFRAEPWLTDESIEYYALWASGWKELARSYARGMMWVAPQEDIEKHLSGCSHCVDSVAKRIMYKYL